MTVYVTNVQASRAASAQLKFDFKNETAEETYRVYLAAPSRDFGAILAEAQRTDRGWSDPIPARGAIYPHAENYSLYVESYDMAILEEHQSVIDVRVQYTSLKPGEEDRSDKGSDPLLWPKEFSISWVEEEYVIEQAYNVQTLGPSGERTPQFGPVVNGALQEFDEPLMATRRLPVLHITYNVASLASAIDLNATYQGTTNSLEFALTPSVSVGVRQAEFLLAETSGKQRINDVDFYSMTLSIAIRSTTDKVINNFGWNNWDADSGKLVAAKVWDAEISDWVRPSEPVPLTLAGARVEDGNLTTITYRYLNAVDYAPLLAE